MILNVNKYDLTELNLFSMPMNKLTTEFISDRNHILFAGRKKDDDEDDVNDNDDDFEEEEDEENPFEREPTDKDIVDEEFPIDPTEDLFDDDEEDDIPFS